MDFHQRLGPTNQGIKQLRQGDFPPTCDHIISDLSDFLLLDFIRHLRATHHNDELWRGHFQCFDQSKGFIHIPNVHAKANDARRIAEQIGHHGVDRGLNRVFSQTRVGGMFT